MMIHSTQLPAIRGSSLLGASVARQGLRSRQAHPGRHPATASLVLACWNVRSLNIRTNSQSPSPAQSAIIDLELTRLGISAALSETWLTGSGSIREANFTFFRSGYPDSEKPMHGVGFAVKNSLLTCIQQPTSISARLMSLRMCLSSGCITIISAYAPTLMSASESKDEFYQLLSETLLSIPAGDSIALIGIATLALALTAMLGEVCWDWMNDNGQRLLELCAGLNLCIASTFFAGPPRSLLHRPCSENHWPCGVLFSVTELI